MRGVGTYRLIVPIRGVTLCHSKANNLSEKAKEKVKMGQWKEQLQVTTSLQCYSRILTEITLSFASLFVLRHTCTVLTWMLSRLLLLCLCSMNQEMRSDFVMRFRASIWAPETHRSTLKKNIGFQTLQPLGRYSLISPKSNLPLAPLLLVNTRLWKVIKWLCLYFYSYHYNTISWYLLP